MTIVGIGFGLLEAAVYAIGASIPEILLRGICLPHAGYGFIVGYFCGKAEKVGKPAYTGIGFLIAWLLHGLYDFSLSEELIALNDNLLAIPLLLALLDIGLVILLAVYVKKDAEARNRCQCSDGPMKPRKGHLKNKSSAKSLTRFRVLSQESIVNSIESIRRLVQGGIS